jgi:hypothetical protein
VERSQGRFKQFKASEEEHDQVMTLFSEPLLKGKANYS